jgi:hypothetical protein
MPLAAVFKVAGVFEEALGKFPVGSVGGYSYFDIRTALQHFTSSFFESFNITNSKLVEFMRDPNKFQFSWFAEEITINIPNRIEVYSNSDYQ